jgi:cobalt/nickel transport system ATP-binding protein
LLEIRNLTVDYPGGISALKNISFTVADGESVAIIGGNGAGKTTLLLAIVGVAAARSGSVIVDGITLDEKTAGEIRRKVGLVFQNPDDQLFMPLIYDDVAFGLRNCGLSEEEIAGRIDRLLSELGISHLAQRSSLRLSGGEKRTAAIASALSMEPSILMLDEPTAYLDPRSRRRLLAQLSAFAHTKLIATHDVEFAGKLCGRAIFLKNGEIAADGGLRELLSDEVFMEDFGL